MEVEKENDATMTIDGVEFKIADISEEVRNEIESLTFCADEIVRLNYLLATFATARNAYSATIRAHLGLPDGIEEKAKH
tara:strand:+ start:235 stop:471 length:237 start_codon:yes stop_codon:yes gene_type:complete